MAPSNSGQPGARPSASKPQRRFQFIDNSNIEQGGANSTQVRRHVMQEYMREKRWENRTKAESGVLGPDAEPTSQKLATASRKRTAQRPRQPHTQPRATESHAATSSRPVQYVTVPSPRQNCQDITRIHLYEQTVPVSTPQDQWPVMHQHHATTPLQSPVQASHPSQSDTTDPGSIDEVFRSRTNGTTDLLKTKAIGSHRDFYLTPQSFAQIADLWPAAALTPPASVTSERSWSPSPSPATTAASHPRCSPQPSSIMSAARTDPFDCLPMSLSEQDQELFDFYANVMPACSYGFERRNPRAHNWYLSVFIPEAMKSAVAFQGTILVHAANTQAWVRGVAETPLAIEHRAKASQMLLEHFREQPFDTSDAAISATLSAAALEDFDPRIERREYAWLHWHAAVQKIRDRGGPAALEQHNSLRMLINWSDYIFSGYDSSKSSFYFDHGSSVVTSDTHEAILIGRREIVQQCEELIVFLKCTEQLALVAANMQHNPIVREDQKLRHSVFQPGQPLHTLLASSNGPRYTKTGQLKQIISRLAALMTINVAIWEYRYSTVASERYFSELVDNIKNNDLDRHISVEALLQILLSGSSDPSLRHTERPWLVGRLLKVAKRLSRSSWEYLNEFLIRCLTLDPSLKPIMCAWEHQLRTEILSAPLVSHSLPLMQGP